MHHTMENQMLAQTSSSDDEDMQQLRTLRAPVPMSQELRTARRAASVSLVVTAVACLCSAVVLVQRHAAGSGPLSATPVLSSRAVGLGEEEELSIGEVEERMSGLMEETRDLQFGIRPSPYSLKYNSILRSGPSVTSTELRRMPSGVQVFPLSRRTGWTQVVVPQMEDMNATFGWLPETVEAGAELLQQDTAVRRPVTPSHWRRAPPSEEQLRQRWSEVKARNAELKSRIADLQASMQSGYRAQARQQTAEGAAQVKREVSSAVHVDEVSKTMHQVHSSLQKELKSPNHVLGELGKLFE